MARDYSLFGAWGAWKVKLVTSTDTPENTLPPDVAEDAQNGLDQVLEGQDHEGQDHEGHLPEPVFNPECTREMVLDIDAEEVSKAYREVTGNYRKHAKIPGFRDGKVPEAVVKSRYASEIRKDVIDSVLPEHFNQGITDLGVKPVGEPRVTELIIEEGKPLHLKAVFEFIPDFSIEGYQSITVEKPSVEVTEEEFKQEMAQLREAHATFEPVEEDRPLVDGDWAQIAYSGKVNGEEAAEPITGEETLLELGGKDTLESFTTALRGAKVGQELKAEVTYPADYNEPRLAGKTVAFDLTVQAIKKRALPELNDDFA
jgi:trigger factor